ncbi:MAG: AMP-binding protein [Pseudomonadota bacterium]
MTIATVKRGLIEALAFQGATSRAYLNAVFEAYERGDIVAAAPAGAGRVSIPGVKIGERRAFDADPGWFDGRYTPQDSDAPAHIAFSSGTTGRPKAVLLSHRALADVTMRINDAMDVDPTIREYVGVPVTFSFGFGRVRAVAAAGGKSFLPANGFNPLELAEMLGRGEVNAVSAVPTLWRLVLQSPDVLQGRGEAVRWIEIGSQYMSREEKEAMKRLFPNARIVQHYGLTEASRTTLLDISDTEGQALESVGKPTGGVQVSVTDDGVIRVRGPHLADGIVKGGGVKSIVNADGWFHTGDRGRIEDGLLYYEGRADDLINCGGVKVDPEGFERALSAALGAPAGALGVGRALDDLRGEKPLVALEARAGLKEAEVRAAVDRVSIDFGLAGQSAALIRTVETLPRTDTGKLVRAKIADLAAIDLDAAPATPNAEHAEPTDPGRSEDVAGAPGVEGDARARAEALREVWRDALGVQEIGFHDNFYDLGGDSLSAVAVMLRMERTGLDAETAEGIFEGKTIAELVGLSREEEAGASTPMREDAPANGMSIANAVNAVHASRGVLTLWVVAIHWLPGVLERIDTSLIAIYEALDPLMRFGTPGFAIVFGLGVGALRVDQFRTNKARYDESMRFGQLLLGGGVAVIALFKFLGLWATNQLGDPILPSRLFYSVLTFYFLIVFALGPILRFATAGDRTVLRSLVVVVALLCVHEALYQAFIGAQTTGFADLIRIQSIAKYGFFKMAAAVMLGAAIGIDFRRRHAQPGVIGEYALVGALLVVFGGLMTYLGQPVDLRFKVPTVQPWHLISYAGLSMLILAGFCLLNSGERKSGPLGWLNRSAIVTGVLALPIFVGHAIVIPAKAVLMRFGAPDALAIALPLGLFLLVTGVAFRRLARVLVI